MKIETILSKNVKNLRKKAGFTQEELSAVAGVSLSVIHTIEYKTKWPELVTLNLIAKALHVDTSRLFQDDSEIMPKAIREALIKLTAEMNKFQEITEKELFKTPAKKNRIKKTKKP